MTFPVVQTTNTGVAESANGTSHTVNLPSGITAGDRLLIVTSVRSAATLTATGWTFLGGDRNGGTSGLDIGWRDADGTEGATVTVTSSGQTRLSPIAYRISGAESGTAPVKGTAATGASTTPDPPSLTPAWGALDTLWIAAFASDGGGSVSAIPTNYSNGLSSVASNLAGTAQRALNAATEDPGTFTATSGSWVAQTIAIKPAPVTDTLFAQSVM